VHLVRQSLGYVLHRKRKGAATELEAIYRTLTEAAAEMVLRAFEQGPLGTRFPTIAPIWHCYWEYLRLVFVYPP